MGIIASNVNGLTIEDNIVGLNTESGYPRAFGISNQVRDGVQMLVRNVTWKDNIAHLWDGTASLVDGHQFLLTGVSGNENFVMNGNWVHSAHADHRIVYVTSGDITGSLNNRFYGGRTASEQFRIDSTEYNLAGYMTAVGDTTSTNTQTNPSYNYGITDYLTSISETATLEAFYTALRSQRKGAWDTNYTAVPIINFVRGAFGRDAVVMVYSTGDDDPSISAPSGLRVVGGFSWR